MSQSASKTSSGKQAKILLCDDHELMREGMASLLSAQPDMRVVGQAADGLEALTLSRDLHPDLIIMDINMPVCDGLEATRLIRQAQPESRIVIMTVHDEDEKLFEAVKSGATGYLLKDTASSQFLEAIRSALNGEAPLPPRLASRLLDEFARLSKSARGGEVGRRSTSSTLEDDDPDLTPREREVLTLIAAGATDKEIAQQTMVSIHTVKTHVRNILGKLHAVNRRHAARLATQRGLLGNNRF